jgi:hypothetical protein
MHRRPRFAALFLVLALAGCAQGAPRARPDPHPRLIRRRTTRLGPSTAAGMVAVVVAECSGRGAPRERGMGTGAIATLGPPPVSG